MVYAATPTDPLTLKALAKVSADSLVPSQQPTPRGLMQQTDCYQMRFLKYPGIAVCHSYAEYVYYILLEMDPEVSAFVPQPFKLLIQGWPRPHIPDCYMVRKGQPQVVELKAPGEMDAPWLDTVAAYLKWYDLPYSVLCNDTVLAYEREALNWLPLIQTLVVAEQAGIDTQTLEYELLERAYTLTRPTVLDLIDPGLRLEQQAYDIALRRLIYRHRLEVDLKAAPLGWETELRACN